jgi:type IV secretion system protein VirB8
VSSTAAIASLTAVIGMLPLRTVEVHVFRVDTATGVVDLVSPLKGTQTYDEAITKYWSARYVRMREGFMLDEAPHAFRTVTLMSGEREQQRFAEFYGPRNPQSPQILYRDGRAVVTIKSITFPTRTLALVRFARTVTRGGQKSESHWVATLGFEYVAAPMAESDRSINPLGFIVNEYRLDPEVP